MMKLAAIKFENEFVAMLLAAVRALVNSFTTPMFMIGTTVYKDHFRFRGISRSFETKIWVSLNSKITVSILSNIDSDRRVIFGNRSCTYKNKPEKCVALNEGSGICSIVLVYLFC
jgi:hypothetical protein